MDYFIQKATRKLLPLARGWKNEEDLKFLKHTPAQILQQKLMDLNKAYTRFFQKRAGFPKFRKKGLHDSFRFPDPDQMKLILNTNIIKLPKIGWIAYYKSQEVIGQIKNVTLSRKGKHWYMSIQTHQTLVDPVHTSQDMVGIDMGITHFATLSNGTHIPALNSFKTLQTKLKQQQRRLSKRKKGSSNFKKQAQKVRNVYSKIANVRKDYLHKLTTQLSKSHATIVLEDLKVANMSQSAKGTKDKPGRYVKAKSGLNRSILDQGWFEFKRQLTYKQLWRGGKVVMIPANHTSQQCSQCGHICSLNRQSQSVFMCQACNHSSNADINAAKNILAAGHAVIACGETLRPAVRRKSKLKAGSLKQEPSQANRLVA